MLIKFELWWFEHKSLLIFAALLLTIAIFFASISIPTSSTNITGMVQLRSYTPSRFGNTTILSVLINESTFVNVSIGSSSLIVKGDVVCLIESNTLIGHNYYFMNKGSCT